VRDVAYTGVCIHLFGDVSAADKQQQAAWVCAVAASELWDRLGILPALLNGSVAN
jgi:hypothetical protein